MASPDPTFFLQDLLSPPSPSYPPQTLARQLAAHLAAVPLSHPQSALVPLLVRYTLSSPSFWGTGGEPEQKGRDEEGRLVFEAVRQGVLLRLQKLSRPASSSTSGGGKGGGLSARRDLHTFLSLVFSGLWADSTGAAPHARLAVASAVLSALQEWKRRKEKLWVSGGKGLEAAEREVGRAWTESVEKGGEGRNLLPAWLAAQTIPFVEAAVLAKEFPASALLSHLAASFSSAFADGAAFSDPPLSADLTQTSSGLSWNVPSPSHTRLTALTSAPLFAALGPLSRAIGRTLEAAALVARSSSSSSSDGLSAIQGLSASLLEVSSNLSAGWAATPWSDILDDSALSPPTREQTALWTLLKALLFAQTLVYSSLLQVVAAGEDAAPTPVQRELATQAVRALGKTYFVALRFGQAGFPAWRAVLAGMVDVVSARPAASLFPSPAKEEDGSAESPAETLVRSLEPAHGTGRGERHDRTVERAEATFWMNTVELVMAELGEEYVERRVLRGIRPYLDDATYRDSFEAAHSDMLAVFNSNKRCVTEVAPWYTSLLLRTYPTLLSPLQLRLAISSMVSSVCTAGDKPLAWWCVEELLAAMEVLPLSPPSSAAVPPSSNVAAPAPTSAEDQSEPAPTTKIEQRALTLPRGAHLLALSSLLPSVSLALLPSLLERLEALIRAEPVESDGRQAVVEHVFEMVGEGMDARKRGKATEWWLRHGRGLATGGPVDVQAGDGEEEAAAGNEEEKDV
ncbi:hypothetical protein JCM10213_007536 [Rhodosporidiobolus nylandii]